MIKQLQIAYIYNDEFYCRIFEHPKIGDILVDRFSKLELIIENDSEDWLLQNEYYELIGNSSCSLYRKHVNKINIKTNGNNIIQLDANRKIQR